MPVLLTGATGYVGGRLLAELEAAGVPVRCLARRPEFIASRIGPSTELVKGDVLDSSSLGPALAGVHTAYYLVHSLGSNGDFERQDREAAEIFGAAARNAGVRRIVYLGGLGRSGEQLSAHLRSRHDTGEALRASGVPVVEFRASVILGSGSLSFDLIRALVERLPAMITPRWVQVKTQPIAIEDIVAYLVAALDLPQGQERVFEVGGADPVSYGEIMMEYARQRGLRRVLIPVPFLSPRLSSLWLGLTTPVYARVGRKLIESVRNPTVVCDRSALTMFPIRPMGFREAIERAISNEDREFAATRWSEAISAAGAVRSWAGVRLGSRLVDSREIRVASSPEAAFAPVRRIGGATGWYFADWLWRLRGLVDLVAGGAGMRRGRRDPEDLAVGDVLDFWRVEEYEPGRRLRLAAEMKVPGRAWLEFEVREGEDGGSTVRQAAVFDPAGLLGRAYWYGVYPLHALVFAGMLRGIARRGTPPTVVMKEGPCAP
ncbi:MAG TPA: SDR family oxidoreductase [Candidatus Polarisedimenticolia bacterium]|nr:SDR family oxidoreductase [Candidatus Polarisedimenticolia bacterium]